MVLGRSTKRAKRVTEFLREQRRFFPSGEVAASVDFVEIEEVEISATRPRLRRAVDVVGKDRDGDR